MTTRAIKRRRDDDPLRKDLQTPREAAPSVMRSDEPTVARIVAMVALLVASVGAFALVLAAMGRVPFIGPGGGLFFLAVGVAGLLYHAFLERDLQYRRVYGVIGAVLLGAGAVFLVLPAQGVMGGLFLSAGVPCLGVALLFLLAFTRNEEDVFFRTLAVRALLVAGILLALIGFIGGLMRDEFLLGQGFVMLLLGVCYLAGFIGTQPLGSEQGYRAGLGLGALGVVMMVIPLGLLFLPSWFGWVRWAPGHPGPSFIFFYVGLEYFLLALGICSDSNLIVMTRRELANYFYSPIAYIVIVAVAVLGWVQYANWVAALHLVSTDPRRVLFEPIVAPLIFDLLPVLCVVCVVPIVTMRLLSEEQRSGTLEVLLTAPVNEWTVVLSKFFGALRFYLLIWYPWGLYLVAARVEGGSPFDYRPLISFLIVFIVCGAHFIALGLFCSAVTRNQIIAAVLTLVGMLALTMVYVVRGRLPEQSAWHTVLTYVSYLDLWLEAVQGNLSPRVFLFHLSAAILWIFLTVKVLEARKWR